MATYGYDPCRSQLKPENIVEFLKKDLKGNLEELSIIGCIPEAIKILRENNITTTYQLFGKFLSLKKTLR